MSEHPIDSLMNTTLQKIKEMVDGNTIIGDPISTPDGSMIIPVSKVTYGFASGGSEFTPCKKGPDAKNNFGGGSGAGVTISPVAFLTISNGNIKLLHVEPFATPVDRVIEIVPGVVDKIGSLFKKNKNIPTSTPDNEDFVL